MGFVAVAVMGCAVVAGVAGGYMVIVSTSAINLADVDCFV